MATGTDADRVRVMHGGKFDPEAVKKILGLRPEAMSEWLDIANATAQFKLTNTQAIEFFQRVIMQQDLRPDANLPATAEQLATYNEDNMLADSNKALKLVYDLYSGQAMGSNFAPDTLWQAVNAVTEYSDHHRKTKTVDARVDSAWFGRDARVKDRAWEEALLMVA
jgi:hypothetical protein